MGWPFSIPPEGEQPMTTEQITKPDLAFSEAPASWNVRYSTPEGFSCQLTLRGENGSELLEKAGIALAFLLEHGYRPEQNQRTSHNHSGDGKQCPIHQCEMKRYEKDGRSWYSHKLENGLWCRGRSQ
jgi:hypothetical protein